MRSLVISIKPADCLDIANRIKKIVVRKTKPKGQIPFKCYIYCKLPKKWFRFSSFGYSSDELLWLCDGKLEMSDGFEFWGNEKEYFSLSGKVIGEFVCNSITFLGNISTDSWDHLCGSSFDSLKRLVTDEGCLSEKELLKYGGKYAWHISDLVIYDKPKKLNEFCVEGDCDCLNCNECVWLDRGNSFNIEDDCILAYKSSSRGKSLRPIKKAPRSWFYVEDIGI